MAWDNRFNSRYRSDKTLPVINELCEANASEGGGVIVLLAERDKLEMEVRAAVE